MSRMSAQKISALNAFFMPEGGQRRTGYIWALNVTNPLTIIAD